jgi:DNA-binding FrmR family transcriptional regulator
VGTTINSLHRVKERAVFKHPNHIGEKDALITRMKRIAGQARGIERMIEEGRYCIDTVHQLPALSSAANGVALNLLQDYIEGRITDSVRKQHGEEYIKDLVIAIRGAMKR